MSSLKFISLQRDFLHIYVTLKRKKLFIGPVCYHHWHSHFLYTAIQTLERWKSQILICLSCSCAQPHRYSTNTKSLYLSYDYLYKPLVLWRTPLEKHLECYMVMRFERSCQTVSEKVTLFSARIYYRKKCRNIPCIFSSHLKCCFNT